MKRNRLLTPTIFCLITLLLIVQVANAETIIPLFDNRLGPPPWSIMMVPNGAGDHSNNIDVDLLYRSTGRTLRESTFWEEPTLPEINGNQWAVGPLAASPGELVGPTSEIINSLYNMDFSADAWEFGNTNKILNDLGFAEEDEDIDHHTVYARINIKNHHTEDIGGVGLHVVVHGNTSAKCWLNGSVVLSGAVATNDEIGSNANSITLVPGDNDLLFKSSHAAGEWNVLPFLSVGDDNLAAEIQPVVIVNGGSKVNIQNLGACVTAFGQSSEDFNGDGSVDEHDVNLALNAMKVIQQTAARGPVVRLYYVHPKGTAPDPGTQNNFRKWALEAQEFYRTEMQRHGKGGKTFLLDTNVRVHELTKTTQELKDLPSGLAHPNNMNAEFNGYIPHTDGAWDIHLFFVDAPIGGYPGAAAPLYRMAYTIEKGASASAVIAHELGHLFGFLAHEAAAAVNINGTNKYSIMSVNCSQSPHKQCQDGFSNPIDKQFLRKQAAKWLNELPLFNGLAPWLDQNKTTIVYKNLKKIQGRVYEVTGKDPSTIELEVKDSDGIRMVMVGIHKLVWDEGLKKEYILEDHDKDGEITHDISLPEDQDLVLYVHVIDDLGNITTSKQGDPILIPNNQTANSPSLVSLSAVETSLLPNYPNPFNPETWIPYQLATSAEVSLTIYDIQGRVVRDLNLGHQRAGMYQSKSRAAYWDGRNAVGEPVASGVYFYTLTAGDFTATRKFLIRQ